MGIEGRVARDSPEPVIDVIENEGDMESGSVYSYRIPEGLYLLSFLMGPYLISNFP